MRIRIEEIPTYIFFEIEQQKQSYPTPYIKHAWLGIVTWHKQQPGKHHIWFVKLPLDERNLLELDPRNAFLRYWQQVVNMPDQEHGEAPFRSEERRVGKECRSRWSLYSYERNDIVSRVGW